ncbi:MAG: SMP-30/gluconolactonase/LRE family protein [Pirellulaceae bacterium]
MQTLTAELLFDAQATLAEGPAWDDRLDRLIWVDIERNTINRFDPATNRNESWSVGMHVGFAVPTDAGDIVAGTRDGIIRLDPQLGSIVSLVDPESDIPSNRFNDGKCDPRGRLFAGSISYDRIKGDASLFRIDEDLSVKKVVSGSTNSNGLCWSADETTFYYIDTPTRQIDAFEYDVETGEISNRRTIISVPEDLGKPDGMTIDQEGKLWVGMFRGNGVTRWDPTTGDLIAKIELPCPNVTSCCFGGHNFEQLFITTARAGMSPEALEQHPLAGGLFIAEPGVGGWPTRRFAG